MQFSLASLVAVGAAFGSVSAAFNAKTDSCAPLDKTFGTKKKNELRECVIANTAKPFTTFNCPDVGQIIYNYQKNTVRLIGAIRPRDGEFTLHGACYYKGSQTAHIDLYMPTPARKITDLTFPGLNRVCDIGALDAGTSDSPWLYFHVYVLNTQELGQCSTRPVKPIRQ